MYKTHCENFGLSFFLLFCFVAVVAELELIWANGEENPNFFSLFGKFAELHWMYNDAANSMAKKVKNRK